MMTAGIMICNILPRTVANTFGAWQAAGPDDGEQDYRQMVRSKVCRSKHFLSDSGQNLLCCLMAWASEPMDSLWHRLQYLDERGRALLDVSLLASANPYSECQRSLVSLLSADFSQGGLGCAYNHFCQNQGQQQEFAGLARDVIMSMASQTYWRFQLQYDDYPYKLLRLVDVRCDNNDNNNIDDNNNNDDSDNILVIILYNTNDIIK